MIREGEVGVIGRGFIEYEKGGMRWLGVKVIAELILWHTHTHPHTHTHTHTRALMPPLLTTIMALSLLQTQQTGSAVC